MRQASLWSFNPHEMRHTCVALLIDQGAHPLAIQRYIGHTDIRTTMNTYGHLFPNHDDEVAHALDAPSELALRPRRGPRRLLGHH